MREEEWRLGGRQRVGVRGVWVGGGVGVAVLGMLISFWGTHE